MGEHTLFYGAYQAENVETAARRNDCSLGKLYFQSLDDFNRLRSFQCIGTVIMTHVCVCSCMLHFVTLNVYQSRFNQDKSESRRFHFSFKEITLKLWSNFQVVYKFNRFFRLVFENICIIFYNHNV